MKAQKARPKMVMRGTRPTRKAAEGDAHPRLHHLLALASESISVF